MPSIKQRIESLEQQSCAGFAGFVVICSWEYEAATSAEALAQYVAANGPVDDGKHVVFIGWGG